MATATDAAAMMTELRKARGMSVRACSPRSDRREQHRLVVLEGRGEEDHGGSATTSAGCLSDIPMIQANGKIAMMK